MEDVSALEDSPRGSIRRSRTEISYNESLADAELEAQLRVSEAAGRGKRTRKAVSYEHAYLTQDWDDDDLEEDEAAYQQRTLRRGRLALNASLFEVDCHHFLLYVFGSLCSHIEHPAVHQREAIMPRHVLHTVSAQYATLCTGVNTDWQRRACSDVLESTMHRPWASEQA